MKECIIPVISVTTRQRLTVFLGCINDQFMKECGIPVISVNTKQLVKDILGIMLGLFVEEWFILVIYVTTRQLIIEVLKTRIIHEELHAIIAISATISQQKTTYF